METFRIFSLFLSVYDDTFLLKDSFPSCVGYLVGPFNLERGGSYGQAPVLRATSGSPVFL